MADQAQETRRPARLPHRAWWIAGTAITLALATAIGVVAFLLSESGLPFIVARIVAQSGGRLSVEGVEGSAASTMRFHRLAWRGSDATVDASEVVVDWDSRALWSSEVRLRGLGAQRIAIAVKPSAGATQPPSDLVLPLDVTIEHVDVGELDWQTGPRTGRITGLAFGYHGNAIEHRIHDLKLVSDYGALHGNLRIGAIAPLPLSGSIAIVGDGPLAGARLESTVTGRLAAPDIAADGSYRESRLHARAKITPFARSPLSEATVNVDGIDVASFAPALPHSRASVDLTLQPDSAGFAGRVELRNVDAGPIDSRRWPVTRLSASYAWSDHRLTLHDVDATIAGQGRATGSGSLDLSAKGTPSQWSLDVRDLDLSQVQTSLLKTSIAGRIVADVENARQKLSVDVRDSQIALRGDATIEGARVAVSRLQMSAGGGSITGSGEVSLDAKRPFHAELALAQFDPSRFGAFPRGELGGHLTARGELLPAWHASVAAQIAEGSSLETLATTGHVAADVAAGAIRNADLDAHIGSLHAVARGNAGAVGDLMHVEVDAQRVADLGAWLPSSVPRPLAGSVRVAGSLRIEPGGPGAELSIHAAQLRAGSENRIASVDGNVQFAPGGNAKQPVPLDARSAKLEVRAQGIAIGRRTFSAVHVALDGTLARHTASIAMKDDAIDVDAQLAGGFTDVTSDERAWKGTLASLDNHGEASLHLLAPAQLSLSGKHQHLEHASFTLADGRIDLEQFFRDASRISTRGSFAHVPLVSATRLAGYKLPLGSTLVLGGAWNVMAAPRLSGTFSVQRESGDLSAREALDVGGSSLPFGVSMLVVEGALRDDVLDARARFAATRAGTAEASVHVGSIGGAMEGTIPRTAPLDATLDASLQSLQVLQPWIGTNAVINGRAQARIAAHGTLGSPILSGVLEGDALEIAAVPYGVHFTDGTLRAHLAEDGIVLEEFAIRGGDGRFSATGTFAAGSAAGRTRVTWQAQQFRVTNRPNLRLVIDGQGTLALEQRRVALNGSVHVDEGHVEYEAQRPGRLSEDVVIEGRPRARTTAGGSLGDVPMILDVDVDFGRQFTFSGEGLDARLAGRVKITSSGDGALRGNGAINTVNGTFYAFGQKLSIDRGRMIFDGALDNPALDVVALRKNLAVEAGVKLTGTVRVPIVQITSNPPVPENEALAWLITGQPLNNTGRNDYAALSAASGALLSGRGGKPLTTEIAQALGLDDISVQSSLHPATTGTSGTSGVSNQVVVFGKRINDRLTLGYEQGVALSSAALRLEYALTRTLTLRLEAGPVSSAGLVYRRNFQ